MMNWFYTQPVNILFETGGSKNLDAQLEKYAAAASGAPGGGFKKGILICDPIFEQNGLSKKIKEYAGSRLSETYSQITPNPLVKEVDACADIIRKGNFDFALAVGGGSAMDLAKAACALAPYENMSVRQFHSGGKVFEKQGIPLIAVPTTAGTGSEVTCVSVLSDPETGSKVPISNPNLYPKLVIVDPEVTVSVPPSVTASTGLDVLSHALEGFWSRNHQPICDALALHSAKIVFDYLLPAFDNGNNLLAREKMCEASIIAGLTFGLPKTAASHAVSYPLTSIYRIPHGEACAFTLDSLCGINSYAENGRLNTFAKELGFRDAFEMGDRIAQIKKYTKMRCTLSDIGLKEEDLPGFVQKCHHPNMLNNPVELDDNMLMRLFLSKK